MRSTPVPTISTPRITSSRSRPTPTRSTTSSKALEEKNYAFVSADISLVPQTYVKLESDEDIKNMEKLLDMLDDNEDVQNTYHNWDQD